MKIWKISTIIILGLITIFITFNLIGLIYGIVTPKIDISTANAFMVYDKDKKLVFKGNGNDSWTSLNDINKDLINATISVEDKNFYSHWGFDYPRIGMAIFNNLTSGKIVQGASTITQQYAKNLFLDFGKSWNRKWKEMWLTYDLETHYTKDEILEGYLNTINYGHGMYGINNASRYYFGKNAKDLSLGEASILAGIPNSPASYSPVDNYNESKKRQKVVLTRMYTNGYISKDEMNRALNQELVFKNDSKENEITSLMYFNDAVMKELNEIDSIPKSYLETGNINIYTSLDIEAQKLVEKSLATSKIDKKVETAKVMMNPKDGSIIALTGGFNYGNSQFNRATDSYRQPGSTVKPFLYYRALESGFTPSSTFVSKDTPFYFSNKQVYRPSNADGVYANKDISMAAAIGYSDNIYAVKTHLFLGEDELYDTLRKVGITSKMEKSPSLALGTYESNIIEMTGAYSFLANNGMNIKPHIIEKVVDKSGSVLYEYENKNKDEQVLKGDITYMISELLTSTYDVNLIDYTYPTCISFAPKATHKYAVKSGSTDTDAWVIGYTPDVVYASWEGYDDNKKISTNLVTKNKDSWIEVMEEYYKNNNTSWFKTPSGVVGVLVNPVTGEVVTDKNEHKKILYYLKGTEPNNKNITNMEVFNDE